METERRIIYEDELAADRRRRKRLHDAAPDLLAALKRAEYLLRHRPAHKWGFLGKQYMAEVRAALTKAQGGKS